jgi:tripartite-type tricarboxylate transporter receptor subunit TctC
VPTLKELGYNVEYYIWSALFAPARTPEDVIKTLRDAMRHVVQDPEFITSMAKLETPIALWTHLLFNASFKRMRSD